LKLEIEMGAVLTPSIQKIVSSGRLNIVVGEAHPIHTPTTPRKYRLLEETKRKNKSGQVKAASSPTGLLPQNRGIQTIAL
jgi:hypothetical protein